MFTFFIKIGKKKFTNIKPPVPTGKKPDCIHDWTNWTQPEKHDVPVRSMWSGESGMATALIQTRTCIKCNRQERIGV